MHRLVRSVPVLASLTLGLAALATAGCAANEFDYEHRAPPRVSVIHHPLHPGTSEPIRLVARPEVAAGRSVSRVEIHVIVPGTGETTHPCTASAMVDGECRIDLPAVGRTGDLIYRAEVVDDRGERGSSPSAYSFDVGDPGPNKPIVLRRPASLLRGDRVFEVLLVRDAASYPDDATVLADVEPAIYSGLLEDPALRWRDDQIAFLLARTPGVTFDYYSGLEARCGQTPWRGTANESDLETAAAFAEVVGVVHRNDFRDCAGLGTGGAQSRFSADTRKPEVFHHELGHALLGLSDEYQETTLTRSTGPPAAIPTTGCTCCDPDDGGSDPTNVGGDLGGGCAIGEPSCVGFVAPIECYPAPRRCPALGSSCQSPNVFPDLAACQSTATSAAAHPGVEALVDVTSCRLLCSGESCPCEPLGATREVWILDTRFPGTTGAPTSTDDVMGHLDFQEPKERFGPACALCLETTFCLKWEEGRGRTRAQAEDHCLVPDG